MIVVEVIIDANSKRYFVMQNIGIHKENLYFGRSGMLPDHTFKLHGIYARFEKRDFFLHEITADSGIQCVPADAAAAGSSRFAYIHQLIYHTSGKIFPMGMAMAAGKWVWASDGKKGGGVRAKG